MQYWERIKMERKRRKETQEEIAKVINVPQSYYSKQERNEKPIQIEQIKLICEHYGISADYLLGLPKGLEYPEEEVKKETTGNCTK